MTTQPFGGLSAIGQINIPVHNLEKAVRFYREVLGMTFLFQVPNMAFFECGSIRLLLAVPEDPAFDHPSSIVYFKVDDVHAVTGALSDRGVDITSGPELVARMPDHDLWMSFFRDSEGNTLALMAELPLKD